MRSNIIRMALGFLLALIMTPPFQVWAQQSSDESAARSEVGTLTAASRDMYQGVQKILLFSAERMPEEQYGFKPSESVRTYAQILGHVADAQYSFCSIVLGEENPAPRVEKSAGSKAELIEALKAAFSYCERAHTSLDDASATEMVTFMGSEEPKLHVLTVNQVHTIEHYGNLVTYMRMNGLVPPTSDPEIMKQLRE